MSAVVNGGHLWRAGVGLTVVALVIAGSAAAAPLATAGPQGVLEGAAGGFPTADWWAGYHDAQLSSLIAEALAGSPSVELAAARVRAAAARGRAARAALYPTLSGVGSASAVRLSENFGRLSQVLPLDEQSFGLFGFVLGDEIDIWGRNRAALAAAVSETEAARMDQGEAKVILVTSLVEAYADFARACAERDAAHALVDNRAALADLARQRDARGRSAPIEAARADHDLAAARDSLADAEQTLAVARDRLALLAGAGPDRGQRLQAPAPPTRTVVALPAQGNESVVGRRPDLEAARLRAEAAARRVDEAKAGRRPRLLLSTLLGVSAVGLGNVFHSGSGTGFAGLGGVWPLLDGRTAAAVQAAEAEQAEATASYRALLLQAYGEVADAVALGQGLQNRLAEARTQLADAETIAAAINSKCDAGLASGGERLAAEADVILARRRLLTLQSRTLNVDAVMARALGVAS